MVARDWDTVVSKPGEFSMSTDTIDKKKIALKILLKQGKKQGGVKKGTGRENDCQRSWNLLDETALSHMKRECRGRSDQP